MENTEVKDTQQTQAQEAPKVTSTATAPKATTSEADYKARIADLEAEAMKWKAASNKASSDAANYKKQLQAKMSEDEKIDAAKAERDEYYKSLERENSIMKQNNLLMSKGFTQDEAQKIAEARYDGDFETALSLENKHYDDLAAKMKKDYEDKVAALATPASGNGQGVDYTAQFNEALAAGDSLAAVGAIMAGSNFGMNR